MTAQASLKTDLISTKAAEPYNRLSHQRAAEELTRDNFIGTAVMIAIAGSCAVFAVRFLVRHF